MVANFRRSLSFPNNPSCTSTSSSSKPKKSFHVRSTSLPCRSSHDPLISHLKNSINRLNIWSTTSSSSSSSKPSPDDHTPGSSSSSSSSSSSAWLCSGLAQLKSVHDSLDDLLLLPQTKETLHSGGESEQLIEKFLEDFLHFVDIYGMFQSLVLSLKDEHLAAQVAVRKRDDSKIQIYLNTLKKMSKEITKLISSLQRQQQHSNVPKISSDAITEVITGIIREVIEVTVSASVALFSGLSVSLASTFLSHRKSSRITLMGGGGKQKKNVVVSTTDCQGLEEFAQIWLFRSLWNLRKKDDEELKLTTKRMYEIEDCIRGIEIGSEKAFRSLINTRVSLLNVLTQ